ncbi:hypothetical protein ABZP36_008493 [Zizania latifolia]
MAALRPRAAAAAAAAVAGVARPIAVRRGFFRASRLPSSRGRLQGHAKPIGTLPRGQQGLC